MPERPYTHADTQASCGTSQSSVTSVAMDMISSSCCARKVPVNFGSCPVTRYAQCWFHCLLEAPSFMSLACFQLALQVDARFTSQRDLGQLCWDIELDEDCYPSNTHRYEACSKLCPGSQGSIGQECTTCICHGSLATAWGSNNVLQRCAYLVCPCSKQSAVRLGQWQLKSSVKERLGFLNPVSAVLPARDRQALS